MANIYITEKEHKADIKVAEVDREHNAKGGF